MVGGRAVEYGHSCAAIGVLPAERHSLILGQGVGKDAKGLVACLARLGIATLGNKGIDPILMFYEVVLTASLELEGLVVRGVKL